MKSILPGREWRRRQSAWFAVFFHCNIRTYLHPRLLTNIEAKMVPIFLKMVSTHSAVCTQYSDVHEWINNYLTNNSNDQHLIVPCIENFIYKVGNVRQFYNPQHPIKFASQYKPKCSSTAIGVYRIKCKECSKVYISETGRSFKLREHKNNCKHYITWKSAISDHTATQKHAIDKFI